jgi:hypothetical protein
MDSSTVQTIGQLGLYVLLLVALIYGVNRRTKHIDGTFRKSIELDRLYASGQIPSPPPIEPKEPSALWLRIKFWTFASAWFFASLYVVVRFVKWAWSD